MINGDYRYYELSTAPDPLRFELVEHPEFERVLLEHYMEVSLRNKNMSCHGFEDGVPENYSRVGKTLV
jgi:hypothetical protein